jgi:hypothetical protein
MRADIVAEQHLEIWLLGVREIDDVADPLHPRITRVDICDHCDVEFEVFPSIARAGRTFGEREGRAGVIRGRLAG